MITFARWRRCLIALIGIGALALALLGGAGALNSTDAAWVDEEQATASFTAGTLGPVQNLECRDKRDTLLGLGTRELELSWQRPEGVPADAPVEYLVTWDGGLLGEHGKAPAVETKYRYEAGPSLADLGPFTFTVYAQLDDWVSDGVGYEAAKLSVVTLGLRVQCTALLGIV
ncbi:hypothetical protein AYJ66_05300 [Dietzia cinnamea]|nr:hypothetical protein AYJ66_05300 [Dietzia cinnamea]